MRAPTSISRESQQEAAPQYANAPLAVPDVRSYRLIRSSAVVIATGVGIALLYFGREVFMPFALAVLLSFLLTPVVTRLQRWHLRRSVAVTLTAIGAFAVFGGVITVVAYQMTDLIASMPRYESNLRERIRDLRPLKGGTFQKTTQTIDDLTAELSRLPGGTLPSNIQKVQVVAAQPTALDMARRIFGSLMRPIASGIVVMALVVFMLIEQAELRDRLLRMIGARDLFTATQALDDAAQRVTRYIALQTVVNSCLGICVALGLYFLDVPNAVLWGTLALVLRFIPYIGIWIAAMFVLAVSVAVFDDWMHPLGVLCLYGVLELVVANVIEPLVYKSGTGVSSLALLMAAAFWTWLWGIPGLLVAVPLTVCLVVAGKHIPNLRFLTVLLSDKPILAPHEQLYQRLLAGDINAAEELIVSRYEQASLAQLADELLLPALLLAEFDRARGVLDVEQYRSLVFRLRELSETHEALPRDPQCDAGSMALVVGTALGEAGDELATALFSRVASEAGFEVRPRAGFVVQTGARNERLAAGGICISVLLQSGLGRARQLAKELRATHPEVPIIVGLWGARAEVEKARQRLHSIGSVQIVTLMVDALGILNGALPPGAIDASPAVAAGTT